MCSDDVHVMQHMCVFFNASASDPSSKIRRGNAINVVSILLSAAGGWWLVVARKNGLATHFEMTFEGNQKH